MPFKMVETTTSSRVRKTNLIFCLLPFCNLISVEIIALPQDEDFWVYFFQEARKWGLAVYNQDWQDFQIVLMK